MGTPFYWGAEFGRAGKRLLALSAQADSMARLAGEWADNQAPDDAKVDEKVGASHQQTERIYW